MKNLSFLYGLMVVTLLSFTLTSCGDDDTPEPDPEPQSITQIAAGDDQFSTLVGALQRVGLDGTLDDAAGTFTVFAPTNAAFTASGINLDNLTDAELTEILLYHVLGGKVASGDLQEGQTYATTATETGPGETQLSVLIEKTAAGAVTVNNSASVMTADVDATNGVIHIVDAVLLPLDVVGHATANSNFSSLVSTLVAVQSTADLIATLSGDGPFTVFAPTNKAFSDIADVTATLTEEQLVKVLSYHVVPGNNRKSSLSAGAVSTVNGEELTVGIDGEVVTLTDATGGVSTVTFTDVQATNGVIHVIDRVVIPQNL